MSVARLLAGAALWVVGVGGVAAGACFAVESTRGPAHVTEPAVSLPPATSPSAGPGTHAFAGGKLSVACVPGERIVFSVVPTPTWSVDITLRTRELLSARFTDGAGAVVDVHATCRGRVPVFSSS